MTYGRYEDRVKYLVSKSRNPKLFPGLKIPRTTANYWIKNKVHLKIRPKEWDNRQSEVELLRSKVQKLREENYILKLERNTLRSYLRILKRNQLIKNISDPKVKAAIVLLIKGCKSRSSIRKVLDLCSISLSQYKRWRKVT